MCPLPPSKNNYICSLNGGQSRHFLKHFTIQIYIFLSFNTMSNVLDDQCFSAATNPISDWLISNWWCDGGRFGNGEMERGPRPRPSLSTVNTGSNGYVHPGCLLDPHQIKLKESSIKHKKEMIKSRCKYIFCQTNLVYKVHWTSRVGLFVVLAWIKFQIIGVWTWTYS